MRFLYTKYSYLLAKSILSPFPIGVIGSMLTSLTLVQPHQDKAMVLIMA